MPKVEPRNVSPVISVIRDVLLGVRYWNKRGKKLILKVKKLMLGLLFNYFNLMMGYKDRHRVKSNFRIINSLT